MHTLAAFVVILIAFSAAAFGQVTPGIPVYPFGTLPGGVTELSPDPARFANPNYPYVIPGTVPPWTLPPSGAYVNPVYAPVPAVPGPIVPRPIVPTPVVPNLNVTPNAPTGPGFLNPNVYGNVPVGSAPPTMIWAGPGVRPFWFNPGLP